MKVRHKALDWNGETIVIMEEAGGLIFRVLWQNEYRAWKTWEYAKELVFIVSAPTRRINNA